jgi:hypothetical protein
MRTYVWWAVLFTVLVLLAAGLLNGPGWHATSGAPARAVARAAVVPEPTRVRWAEPPLPSARVGMESRRAPTLPPVIARALAVLDVRLQVLAQRAATQPRLPQALLVVAALLAGLVIFTGLWSLVLMLRPSEPAGVVSRLARRGHATARIARETRLAQDAVRLLLEPEWGRVRGRKEAPPGRQELPVSIRGQLGEDPGIPAPAAG